MLAAMLGIILIIATPMDALRMAMAHYTALLVQDGQDRRPSRTWCVDGAGIWRSRLLLVLVVGDPFEPADRRSSSIWIIRCR